jgi:hypothetical protein
MPDFILYERVGPPAGTQNPGGLSFELRLRILIDQRLCNQQVVP